MRRRPGICHKLLELRWPGWFLAAAVTLLLSVVPLRTPQVQLAWLSLSAAVQVDAPVGFRTAEAPPSELRSLGAQPRPTTRRGEDRGQAPGPAWSPVQVSRRPLRASLRARPTPGWLASLTFLLRAPPRAG